MVRREIGAHKEALPEIAVKGAEPRENYFQALSMFRKTQRLCFDLTGDNGTIPASAPAAAPLSPAHVFAVVDAALVNVRRVKTQLGITEESHAPARDEGKTPSDVFRSIVHAGRQLSLMLDTRPTPTTVYEQLTDAVGTAHRILTRFPDAIEPKVPAFKHGKSPGDVHCHLVRCYEQVSGIMKRSGLSSLEVDWKVTPEQVTPSNVYDMATLLVSELRYIESKLPPSTDTRALDRYSARTQIACPQRSTGRLVGSPNRADNQASGGPP